MGNKAPRENREFKGNKVPRGSREYRVNPERQM